MYNYLVNENIEILPSNFVVDSREDPDSSNSELYKDIKSAFLTIKK